MRCQTRALAAPFLLFSCAALGFSWPSVPAVGQKLSELKNLAEASYCPESTAGQKAAVAKCQKIQLDRIRRDQTHYEVLCSAPWATAEDVKKQHRTLSLTVHPDKCTEPECADAMQRLNEARDVISNETARAAYDKSLAWAPLSCSSSDSKLEIIKKMLVRANAELEREKAHNADLQRRYDAARRANPPDCRQWMVRRLSFSLCLFVLFFLQYMHWVEPVLRKKGGAVPFNPFVLAIAAYTAIECGVDLEHFPVVFCAVVMGVFSLIFGLNVDLIRRTGPDDDAYDSESDFAPEDQAARAARLRAERGWSYGKGPFTRLEKKRQDEFLDHLMMASVSIFLVVFVAVLAMK